MIVSERCGHIDVVDGREAHRHRFGVGSLLHGLKDGIGENDVLEQNGPLCASLFIGFMCVVRGAHVPYAPRYVLPGDIFKLSYLRCLPL